MDDAIVVAVIAGTARDGRESINAARWVADQGRDRKDVVVVFVDPLEHTMSGDGDNEATRDKTYAEIVSRANAFYIVTPEYNHSFPGSLKRLLDSEFDNYLHKPVATAGVSSGNWGGVRACEALLPVYHTMGMVVVKPELYFPRVQEIFGEDGKMKTELVERYQKSVNAAYDELVWFARRLRESKD